MARVKLAERIGQGAFFVDGAMGTQLMARGVDVNECTDYLNVKSPEIVADVHKAYLEAGSDAIITNTFGANEFSLSRHGRADQVAEINLAAAQLGRTAAGEDKYVLGGFGPCGDFLEPLGHITESGLVNATKVQAEALVEGGVDGFIVETMTAIEELLVVVKAIREVSSELPLFVSLAYDPAGDEFRTMMGVEPAIAVEKLADAGINAIGFNCGTLTMEQYIEIAQTYSKALAGTGILLLAEANAGIPDLVDNKAVYNLSPADFAIAMEKVKDAGATILGGCCGTSPEHIGAMADRL